MKRALLLVLVVASAALVGFSMAEDLPLLDRRAKIIFVGDIFLDRYIRQMSMKSGEDYLFECVDPLFKSADAVVGNLEGPITSFPSRSLGSTPGSPDNFVFTFSTTSAKLLERHNVKIVSLGNNHIGNFGKEGIAQTKSYLAEAGVGYFGGLLGDEPIYRTKVNGHGLSFLAYNQFGGDMASALVKEIKREKMEFPQNKVIIFAHWGEEYVEPTYNVRRIAHSFADAGADLVIGSHPHVVQSSENIGSTTIYYSLGNFMFDQYWDDAVSTGLAVELNLSGNGMVFSEHKLKLHKTGQTCLK